MPKLTDNLHRFSIALGALLFVLCSVATRTCVAGEQSQTPVAAHACCTNEAETAVATDQMACCADIASGIVERKELHSCNCITQSRSVDLWQTSLFTPDFIHSSYSFDFNYRTANSLFCDVPITPVRLWNRDSSSRAPPPVVSLSLFSDLSRTV